MVGPEISLQTASARNERARHVLRISIRNFRGIESLDGSGFRRINLIVGRNNSGKTTFLEGLLLLGGAMDPMLPSVLGQLRCRPKHFRGLTDPGMETLFHDLDPKNPGGNPWTVGG